MKLILTILLFFAFCFSTFAKENNFFVQAKKLFEEEKFEESKFLFQRNIVYNPKDAKSYLYLAKIFKKEEDNYEEEKNLNTALLLEPRNEEAMYLLIDIELNRSNFSKVEELKNDFKKICSSLCEKISSIDSRLKEFEKKDAS
jgi:tetratricopeptide (TPR) repeat protein